MHRCEIRSIIEYYNKNVKKVIDRNNNAFHYKTYKQLTSLEQRCHFVSLLAFDLDSESIFPAESFRSYHMEMLGRDIAEQLSQ